MANPRNEKRLAGVIGFFDHEGDLVTATEKVKNAKYQHFDAFSPYPVHGLDSAQGLKRSPLPLVTFAAGITGCTLGFLLQYWTSAVDWPLNVGGKPFNSWPAFVPVMFELTILFAGLATAGGMFLFNGLPNVKRKIFDPKITRDQFALVIEANIGSEDTEAEEHLKEKSKNFKAFVESEAIDFLKNAGAKEVKSVYTEGWF